MGKRIIYFADFETATVKTDYYKKTNDTRLNLGYIEPQNSDDGFLFTDIKELIHFLWEKSRSCFIYFHNLSWDGDFILKWLAKNGYKAQNQKEISKNKEFSFLRQINKIYSITLLINGKKNNLIKIEFRCSLNILSSSIEALGKAVGINKYDGIDDVNTFYDVEPQECVTDYPTQYIEYLKRDVKIAKKAMSEFDKELTNFVKNNQLKNYMHGFKWYSKLTIGAIAYELQRRYTRRVKKVFRGLKVSVKSHDIADLFYFGGFCEFNPNIQNKIVKCKNGIGLDINSAHPNSMTKMLPYGEVFNLKDKQPDSDKVLYYYEIKVGFASAKWDTFPCLINWNKINKTDESKNRYVLQLSNFTCYYLKEEWETINKLYDFENVKIVNTYWCYASRFLEQYTKDLYHFKKEHSKNGQKALANTYKILLNSSYGKHATRLLFSEYLITQNKADYDAILKSEEIIIGERCFVVSEANKRVILPNQYILKITPTDFKDLNFNKMIAATITAYTRIKIFETVLMLNPKNFLYSDTDSLYLKDYDKNKVQTLLDDYELGMWKKEKEFSNFCVAGSKCYIHFNGSEPNPQNLSMTYSGINKRWLKDNWDIGMWKVQDKVLLHANLKIQACESGLVLVESDYKPHKRLY